MNSSFRGGLLAGFILGAAVMALAAMLLRPRPVPEPPMAVAVATASLEEKRLAEENKRLKSAVAELEEKAKTAVAAASAKKEEKPTPPPPPSGDKPAADYRALFAKLSELGMMVFANPKYKETIDAVKSEGKPALEFLVNALRTSKSAGERFAAAAVMDALADPSTVDALAVALKGDGDDLVRRVASHALAVMGAPAVEAPLRAAAVDDADWGVRVNSAYGLAKLGKEDGLKILTDAYEAGTTPAEYRLAVLGGLADVAAPSTAPLFRKILSDTKDATYLLVSVHALEKMKDAQSIPALQAIADSTQPETVRQAAARAIDAIRK